ncbi:MAG: NAAT family transporter [Gammaproteobacteria bacterium]|nr:NAAT family transporter [Gammaproteobacteria bacterium]MCW5583710.1 NAAT family transporter [Gammaproteobacteria bacterium]
MSYADTVKFLVAMIIMMNPLGSLSIFLQLTSKFSLFHQRKTAVTCGLSITIIMVATIWIGSQLLDLLGITISSFRFAGGIILLLTGLSMLQSKESPISHTPEDDIAAEERHSIAIVPLALPIIIGPGAISTLVIASNDYPNFTLKLWLSILCIILALSMFVLLYYGAIIGKLVGESVMKVITRIMGMIIMAIAVGMLANGLIGLIPALR